MAKLTFYYGTMGSSKSAQALMTVYNYKELGIPVTLYTIANDREKGKVTSRIGLSAEATTFDSHTCFKQVIDANGFSSLTEIIVIDEAQFLTEKQIMQLTYLVDHKKITVICFYLRILKCFPPFS